MADATTSATEKPHLQVDAAVPDAGPSARTGPGSNAPSATPSAVSVAQAPHQVSKLRFILIFLSLMLCIFLFAVCPLLPDPPRAVFNVY